MTDRALLTDALCASHRLIGLLAAHDYPSEVAGARELAAKLEAALLASVTGSTQASCTFHGHTVSYPEAVADRVEAALLGAFLDDVADGEAVDFPPELVARIQRLREAIPAGGCAMSACSYPECTCGLVPLATAKGGE